MFIFDLTEIFMTENFLSALKSCFLYLLILITIVRASFVILYYSSVKSGYIAFIYVEPVSLNELLEIRLGTISVSFINRHF